MTFKKSGASDSYKMKMRDQRKTGEYKNMARPSSEEDRVNLKNGGSCAQIKGFGKARRPNK